MRDTPALLSAATRTPQEGAELCTTIAKAAHQDSAGILRTTMAAGALDEAAARGFLQLNGNAIDAEATMLELTGAAALPLANAITLKFLNRAYAESDDMPLMDMADIVMKHTMRIVEMGERARLAESARDDDLPMVNITINTGGGIRLEVVPRADDDAIDVQARDMDGEDLV